MHPTLSAHVPHAQDDIAILETTAACVRLRESGVEILGAHVHGGMPVIVVDRRPPIEGLVPGCLRCDRDGTDYHACLDGVRVAWHEPPRRITRIPAGERLAVSLGHISPRGGAL